MFRIAHISDLHIPPLPQIKGRDFASKRLLGLFSWHHKWKAEHRIKILESLQSHLKTMEPDHYCITGDITFTTHPEEVDKAAEWMNELADPQCISLIPGNHDAYVPGAIDYVVEKWGQWMKDDDGREGFPYLHRRGPVDIVGLSSAIATPPAISLGKIGPEQLAKTKNLLDEIKSETRTSFVMLHHPPQDGHASRYRCLVDRKELQEVLAGSDINAVLHGHLHHPIRASLDRPSGAIPVLGAASASAIGGRKSAAHYHIIDIDDSQDSTKIEIQHFQYNKEQECFVEAGKHAL